MPRDRLKRPWLSEPNAARFENSVRQFLELVGPTVDHAKLAELPSPEARRYIKTLNWLEMHYPRSDSATSLPRVCDLGGYFGIISHSIRSLGYDVDLVDNYSRISGSEMRALQRWWEVARISPHHCDLQDPELELPFADSSFDVVALLAVIEHFASSPRLVLQETYRILRPGGHLILDTPHAGALGVRLGFLLHGEGVWSNIDDFYAGDIPYWGHKRCYSRRELEYILREAGFQTVTVDLFELAGRDHSRSWRGRLLYDYLAPLSCLLVPDLHNYVWVIAKRPS